MWVLHADLTVVQKGSSQKMGRDCRWVERTLARELDHLGQSSLRGEGSGEEEILGCFRV